MIAKFSYWDANMSKRPYYTLLEAFKGHPEGTTLCDYTLNKLGIPIPLTPTLKTYEKLVKEGLRCKTCWDDPHCQCREL